MGATRLGQLQQVLVTLDKLEAELEIHVTGIVWVGTEPITLTHDDQRHVLLMSGDS